MAKSQSSRKTAARGRTARGPTTSAMTDPTAQPPRATAADPGPTPRPTKQALILGLLQRPEGATLSALMAATGWLPHTTRAALTRMRQAGHLLEKTTGETGTVYRIATRPAARSRKAA